MKKTVKKGDVRWEVYAGRSHALQLVKTAALTPVTN
jgi:hypothetical protein